MIWSALDYAKDTKSQRVAGQCMGEMFAVEKRALTKHITAYIKWECKQLE